MSTKKNSDDTSTMYTQPVSTFGTSPNLAAQLKPTNYDGMLLKERYLIEGELGRGGIGVVYLARDTRLLQRRVVIKVLLQDMEDTSHTAWFRRKFEQEIEALVRLDHPGIVGALDTGAMPDGKLFLVMQFVEGATLRSLMKGETMSFARIAKFMRQIGAALSAAHDKGVIHRDLKPENIMAQTLSDGEELIKLIDFGIATVKDSQITTFAERTKVAGAVPYMSPEQLCGLPEISSDIWAMGVIAYELVTGRLPFSAVAMAPLYEMQRTGPENKPSSIRGDLPAAAERAILKGLAFNPHERFARAKDFGNELAQALTEPATHSDHFQTTSPAPETARSTVMVSSAPTEIAPAAVAPAETAPAPTPAPIPGKLIAAIILVFVIIAALIWFLTLRNGTSTQRQVAQMSSPSPAPPSRSLNYSLRVLAKGSNQKPVELPGEVIFTPGDELCFIFDSPQSGYLYIINEGPNLVDGLPQYNFLFPDSKLIADGAPSLEASQKLFVPSERPPWFQVDIEQGAEKHWLIWAERPIAELEALKKWLNETDGGEIKDANEIRTLQQFLNQNFPAARPVAEEDDHQTHLKGGKDGVLIFPVKLEHR